MFISTTNGPLLLVTKASQIYRTATKICCHVTKMQYLIVPVEKMKANYPQKNPRAARVI